MSNGITFTVTLTDEQIDRAIGRACQTTQYDEDGEAYDERVDLAGLVRERLGKLVDAEISKVTTAVVREVVEERVRKSLDDGFPIYSTWGECKGTKSLAEIVGEFVFNKRDRYDDFDMHRFIHDQAKAHAKEVVAKAVKAAGDDIDKMFKDAAAEGIAQLFKRKLGIG